VEHSFIKLAIDNVFGHPLTNTKDAKH